MNKHKHTIQIKQIAADLGFSACGITEAKFLSEDAVHLKKWLQNSMHGDMTYMENHFEKRVDVRKLVDNARSVISVLLNYYPEKTQIHKDAPVVSKYAYGEDYHHVIKNRLFKLAEQINIEITPANGRAFVDSAPVLDRSNARFAGLGWIGKNSNLINKELGSFVFIGELIVDIELEYDQPINDYCGSCTKCIEACPTNAITAPRIIDSRKCIAYLTVEHKGEMPSNLKGKFENRVFGCDICQDVCPWNKNAIPTSVEEFIPLNGLLEMTREDWYQLDEKKFNEMFRKSALKRRKFEGLKKNLNFL